jgi:hypothetical protein
VLELWVLLVLELCVGLGLRLVLGYLVFRFWVKVLGLGL